MEQLRGTGLGLVTLALERLRGGRPAGALDLTVGLVSMGGAQARRTAARVAAPTVAMAQWCAIWAGRMPGASLARVPLGGARRRWESTLTAARRQGARQVAAGREQALRVLLSNVDDALDWAQSDAAPRLVDGLLPHLSKRVVPRIIDDAVPQIRSEVLPVVIADLTTDERVRELILDQSRGVLGEVAQQVRTNTAGADDRVESAVRRLFGRRPVAEGG